MKTIFENPLFEVLECSEDIFLSASGEYEEKDPNEVEKDWPWGEN